MRAIIIFLLGVAMASAGQILLKRGALRGRPHSILASLFNPWSMAGYGLMLGSTVTSTIALKRLPLHMTVSLAPLGFVVVTILSVTILHEKLQRHHLGGMLLILSGVIIFTMGSL